MTDTPHKIRLAITPVLFLVWCLASLQQQEQPAWALSPSYDFEVVAEEGGSVNGYGLRNLSAPLSLTDNGEVLFTAMFSSRPAGAPEIEDWSNGLFTQNRRLFVRHGWNNSRCFLQYNTPLAMMNGKGDLLVLCNAEPGSPKQALFYNDELVAETGGNIDGLTLSAFGYRTYAGHPILELTDSDTFAFLGLFTTQETGTAPDGVFIGKTLYARTGYSHVISRAREVTAGEEICSISDVKINERGDVAFLGVPFETIQHGTERKTIECPTRKSSDGPNPVIYKNKTPFLGGRELSIDDRVESFHLSKLRNNGQLIYEVPWRKKGRIAFIDRSILLQPGDMIGDHRITTIRKTVATEDSEFFSVYFEAPHKPGIATRQAVLIQQGDQLKKQAITSIDDKMVVNRNGSIAFKVKFDHGPEAIIIATPVLGRATIASGYTSATTGKTAPSPAQRSRSLIPAFLIGGFILWTLYYLFARNR